MYRSPALSVLDPLRLEELKATGRLPSPQGVALRIVELTRRNDADLNGIAAVARTDPALTARILKAANAPAMGLTRPLVTVRDALLLLGLPAARKLVLGFSLVPAHRQGACIEFDYVRYWRQSIVTGLAAQGIAARLQTGQPLPVGERVELVGRDDLRLSGKAFTEGAQLGVHHVQVA